VENKKIKGATECSYDNIDFRSKLEVTCYKILKDSGLNPLYEEKKYPIFEGFVPQVPFYVKNTFKRKNRNIQIVSKSTAKDSRKILSWDYTPDFYFEHNAYKVFVEVKGFYNDIARYKSKLFRWKLESFQKEDPEHIYEFWEIHTKTQLLECIHHIKEN
jgi:predicted nuclease of restriction endonuclease-like RecB superfamily